MKQTDIAKKLGVTPQRVSQIVAKINEAKERKLAERDDENS